MRECARGESDRKLIPIEDPVRFEDEIECDYPVDLIEPLAFLFARMIGGLITRLATRGLATNEIVFQLHLESRIIHERTLSLPVPSLDKKAFLKLFHLDLEAHPPSAPVLRLFVRVNPIKPRSAQTGLFVPVAPEPVKLEVTLARITAVVGEGRVGSPELVNTHRPDAFWLRPFGSVLIRVSTQVRVGGESPVLLSVRMFRPPRSARVQLVSGQPSFVDARDVRGRVINAAGPWRTSGDWWTSEPWASDEWDIALSDGSLYLLSCGARGWFVEGSYD